MKSKTYRVDGEIVKGVSDKAVEYIVENKALVTEAQIINVSIKKGLECLTHEEITEFIDSNNK